jgi:hypothetical protein
MRHALLHATALSALAAAVPVDAQTRTLDEGRFEISRSGVRLGTEDFQIRRSDSPGGAVLVASATIIYERDDRRLAPALRTDSAGAPLAYQLEVRVGGSVKENLSGQVGRGRFSARLRSPGGESVKEYIVASGALVLDDDVFHQYYFLGLGPRNGTIPVVIPRRNIQVSMTVSDRGAEALTIGGSPTQARHLVLSDPEGGARHVWVDAAGRVLKVQLDGRGLVATRDELPR